MVFEVTLFLFFNTVYTNLYSHVEKTKRADKSEERGKILCISSSFFSVKRIQPWREAQKMTTTVARGGSVLNCSINKINKVELHAHMHVHILLT